MLHSKMLQHSNIQKQKKMWFSSINWNMRIILQKFHIDFMWNFSTVALTLTVYFTIHVILYKHHSLAAHNSLLAKLARSAILGSPLATDIKALPVYSNSNTVFITADPLMQRNSNL